MWPIHVAASKASGASGPAVTSKRRRWMIWVILFNLVLPMVAFLLIRTYPLLSRKDVVG
jgi:hypothetical protein